MSTPAIYRTRVTHMRRAPVHHYFDQSSYSWYIDVEAPPRLAPVLRPFARFEAADHLTPPGDDGPDTLRRRVDVFLAEHDIDLGGGQVTALLQARVLGYVFNPLSLFWCCDAGGNLRAVIAEVHNTYGQRHAYLLPTEQARVPKRMTVSPFNAVDGHYLVRAPRPTDVLDVSISLHREGQPAFVATLRGTRRKATNAAIARLQITAPLAPLMGAIGIRIQGITLWLKRVPVVRREAVTTHKTTAGLSERVRQQ